MSIEPSAAREAAALLRGTTDDALGALFARGRRVAVGALDAETRSTLEAVRLVAVEGDEVVPLVRVSTWREYVLVHDADAPGDLSAGTVLGINNTTRTLASLTPRRHVGRALDVATGGGVLALCQAEHSDSVVATDLSARAVHYAALNAALNDVELDVRQGDLFAPVAGETFDLITANLPFVVSPDTSFLFRDGGHGRDEVSRRAVVEAARHLAPDGTAVLLCNWIVPAGAIATDRVESWVKELGCSAVVVHHSTDEPEAYARRWNEFLLTRDPVAYAAAVAHWLAAYGEWGIEGIASGAVVLRRDDSARPAVVTTTMDVVPEGDGGAQVLRVLDNAVVLHAHRSDEDVLAERLALVAPHRLEQTMHYDGTWTAHQARMILADTAGPVGQVDPLAMHVVLRLDGTTPLRDVVEITATDTGLDVEELRRASVDTCRHLLAQGCLDVSPS